ncbi:MAG: carboxypeptidase regulatory-like domain-containing protein [Pseudomonadota bacterium]
MRAYASAFAIFITVLSGCSKTAEVTGEVLDNFGNPLSGATVKVLNTTFTATTNGDGHYAVGYVPGKIGIVISKEGYTSTQFSLDISTEAKYPAQPVTLYKLPSESGIVAVGVSDYVPLQKGKLSVTSQEFRFSWDKPLSENIYTVAGEFTALDGKPDLTFLDTNKNALQIFAIAPAGVILRRTKKYMDTEDTATTLADSAVQVAPGLWLRKVTLAAGKYAFVTRGASGSMAADLGYHPVLEPVYLFEVR